MAKSQVASNSEEYYEQRYRLSGTGFDTVISGLSASGTTLTVDYAQLDQQYQPSGTAPSAGAGAGLVFNAGSYNVQVGSGLYVTPDYVGADLGFFDGRYALSGTGGGGGPTLQAGSGLVKDGTNLHVQVTGGLTLLDDSVEVDFSAVQASGNYPTVAEADARYEASGAVDEHEELSNPHPQYLTQAEGDALYPPQSRTITAGNGLTGGGDLSADRTVDVVPGSGLYVLPDEIGFDTAFGDSRYSISGGEEAQTSFIWHAEDEGEDSTTSSSYQQKVRLTFIPNFTGDYEIRFYAETTQNHNNARVYTRVQIDDTDTIAEQERVKAGSNTEFGWDGTWFGWGGIGYHAFTSGVSYDIDLDYHSQANKSMRIRRGRLSAERTNIMTV